MKKIIVLYMVGLMIISSNLYAANGDLIVNGKVGIGTTAPGGKLTVSRSTQGAAYQAECRNEGGISDGNYDGIGFTQGSGAIRLAGIRVLYHTNGLADLGFYLRENSAGAGESQRMIILSNGNVGIGTTTPNAKLQVKGSVGLGSGTTQANKALCWTSTGTIGYCSSAIDASGGCSCNTIN